MDPESIDAVSRLSEMTLSGELDQLFDAKGVGYSKDAADKIREANA